MSKKAIIARAQDYAIVAAAINKGTCTADVTNGVVQIGVHRPDNSAVGVTVLDKERGRISLKKATQRFAKDCGLA